MHKHFRKLIAISSLTLALVPLMGAVALAAKPAASAPSNIGNDISWPQCNKAFPTGQAFGIVGVNDGYANGTNPCLDAQLTWAKNSTGAVLAQPKIQLYVNTANPGGLNTTSWPKDNTDPAGNAAPNTYGTCDGSDSLQCAWQYGWNRAVENTQQRFIPAAQKAVIDANPAGYIWWLDVETVNTWKTGTEGIKSNAADLEGMVAYLKTTLGATVGLYSTGYQWGQIVGTVDVSSNLNNLKSWLAGGRNQAGAKSLCTAKPLTTGSSVVLTQYVSGAFDYNYSCI